MAVSKKTKYSSYTKDMVDYKNIRFLRQFLDRFGRIKARYYTGATLKFQKSLETAVKRARVMGLLPFTK